MSRLDELERQIRAVQTDHALLCRDGGSDGSFCAVPASLVAQVGALLRVARAARDGLALTRSRDPVVLPPAAYIKLLEMALGETAAALAVLDASETDQAAPADAAAHTSMHTKGT